MSDDGDGIPLTSCARDAVKAALRFARERDVEIPTTRDLLMGLMEQREALVVRVLEEKGLYAAVAGEAGQPDASSIDGTPATAAVKVAVAEATTRRDSFLGAEHLLWGLLDDSAGETAALFDRLGVRSALRAAVAELLDEPGAA